MSSLVQLLERGLVGLFEVIILLTLGTWILNKLVFLNHLFQEPLLQNFTDNLELAVRETDHGGLVETRFTVFIPSDVLVVTYGEKIVISSLNSEAKLKEVIKLKNCWISASSHVIRPGFYEVVVYREGKLLNLTFYRRW